MLFTQLERTYLLTRDLPRLATITPAGFIDIGGPNPNSQRYRNVKTNPNVSLAIDDMTPNAPARSSPAGAAGSSSAGRPRC